MDKELLWRFLSLIEKSGVKMTANERNDVRRMKQALSEGCTISWDKQDVMGLIQKGDFSVHQMASLRRQDLDQFAGMVMEDVNWSEVTCAAQEAGDRVILQTISEKMDELPPLKLFRKVAR